MKEMPPILSDATVSPPDARGRFGAYGGRFVPETLIPALDELERSWKEARADPRYREELTELVATATVCALLGLECIVYMGTEDVRRQSPNVVRMKLLGAEVRSVDAGSRTLKDAMNEAIRDWVTNVRTTYYCIGSAAGPHPYPVMVRELQKIIGEEVAGQIAGAEGRLPDAVVACVGGGSNAIGALHRFVREPSVTLYGVEAAGHGLESGKHGASLAKGRPGVLHGSRSYVLQTEDGQIAEAHSISAGLDYPGVGPELSHLRDQGRLTVLSATDTEALQAFQTLARSEGILCALESAHAIAALPRVRGGLIVVNLSGRGDKDLGTVIEALK